MTITKSGNVGIGTTSPSAKLDIKDGALKVKQDTGNNDNCLIINPNNHNNGVDIECLQTTNANTKKAICLNSYGGYVGIGTTNPESALHVVGNRQNTPTKGIHMGEGGTGDYAIEICAAGTDKNSYIDFTRAGVDIRGRILYYHYDNHMAFFTNGNNERMRIASNGHIGFRTTNPWAPFHFGSGSGAWSGNHGNTRIVDGHGLQTGANNFYVLAYFRGDICAKGNVASVGFDQASDERIKENIVDANASEILDLFRNIELKRYNYIDKFTRGTATTVGFIAQQIQQIIPSNVKRSTQTLPNIYKTGTVSGVGNNIITFTDFNTANLLTGDNVTGIIEIDQYPSDNDEIKTKIKTVIDQNTIEVEDDLSKYMGDIDDEGNAIEGTKVFVFGQEVNDLLLIDKIKIFTIATAALQEVDRQLQAEKAKTATLETKTATLEAKTATLETTVADLVARITALENA
tara:strand:- start:70 stop:1449 length:1380 start_codon:yes stop_codon:yes gene_type:complete